MFVIAPASHCGRGLNVICGDPFCAGDTGRGPEHRIALFWVLGMSSISVYSISIGRLVFQQQIFPAGRSAGCRSDVQLRSLHGSVAHGSGDACGFVSLRR